MVVGHKADGTSTRVTAQDPEHPNTARSNWSSPPTPVELRQWVITDDLGQQTTVILGADEEGRQCWPILFSITREMEKRGN
jgi:hypothetical protein